MRYILRKSEQEAARERHRLEDKIAKLARKITARNEVVQNRLRCQPEGNDNCKRGRNGTSSRVGGVAGGWQAGLERQEEKMEKALDLAGDYVVITDVLQRAAGREKFGTTDEDPQAIACGMRSRRSANCGARI